jgi:outer membrane murein-binding lipoprotein Lpp
MEDKIITNFPITVYGKMEKYSDTISRGRCRVFYKGRNRNGTYITDEFAEKLIKSAPYTPVKGIYEVDDYTDHGKKRSEGRIYGIVPMDHNFAWEKHVDSDGVEREYACFDVLYYTALYKEAGEIDGKSESMELFRDTLKGDWKIMDGKKTYVFTDGCFLGLQALGDDVEPCFEGASFYSLEDNIIALLEKYEKRTDLFQNHEQGGNTMPSINFKISDGQKYDFLFRLLNPNFNEEGGWAMEYAICDVYEEYAIVRNFVENIFERVYYTKDDANDSLEITNKERCYIVDVNETERAALDSLKGEGTYAQAVEAVAEKDTTISSLNEEITTLNSTVETLTTDVNNLTEQNSQYSTQIEELNNSISTLTVERDEAQSNYDAANASLTEVNNNYNELNNTYAAVVVERDSLLTYKKNIEDEAKKAVVNEYVEHLSEEVIETYMNNLDSYTIEELDMKLTYEQKKANPGLFSKQVPAPGAYIPKDDSGNCGINNILSRYEKH